MTKIKLTKSDIENDIRICDESSFMIKKCNKIENLTETTIGTLLFNYEFHFPCTKEKENLRLFKRILKSLDNHFTGLRKTLKIELKQMEEKK